MMWKENLLTLLLFASCAHSYVQVRSEDEVSCTRAGYFTHPTDCARFYRCVDYFGTGVRFTTFHYVCPLGTIFDESISVCNHPAWVQPPPACLAQLPTDNGNAAAPQPESSVATGGVVPPAPAPEPVQPVAPAPEEGPTPVPAPEEVPAPVPAPEESVAPVTEEGPAPEEGSTPVPVPEKVPAPVPAPEEVPAPVPAPEESVAPSPEEGAAPVPEVTPKPSEAENQGATTAEPEGGTTLPPTEEGVVEGPQSQVAPPEQPEAPVEQPDKETSNPEAPEEEQAPESATPGSSTAVSAGQISPAAGSTTPNSPTFFLTCGGKDFYRHPMLCNRFYQCLWDGATISVVMFACGEGLVFDEPTKQCTAPDQTTPCQELTTSTVAPVLVTPESAINANKTYTVAENSLYQCPHPGHFPYELDCLRFYRCFEVSPGVLTGLLYRCPAGYGYSDETERCQKQADLTVCDKTQSFYSRVPVPQIPLEQTVVVRVEDFDKFFSNPNFFYSPSSQ